MNCCHCIWTMLFLEGRNKQCYHDREKNILMVDTFLLPQQHYSATLLASHIQQLSGLMRNLWMDSPAGALIWLCRLQALAGLWDTITASSTSCFTQCIMDNCTINCYEYKLKLRRNHWVQFYALIAAADSCVTLTVFGWSFATLFMSSYSTLTLLTFADKVVEIKKCHGKIWGSMQLCKHAHGGSTFIIQYDTSVYILTLLSLKCHNINLLKWIKIFYYIKNVHPPRNNSHLCINFNLISSKVWLISLSYISLETLLY